MRVPKNDRFIKDPVLQEILFSLQPENKQTSELRVSNLIGQKVRGLEIFWDNKSGQVRCYLTSERDDAPQFKKSFELYGSSSVADCLDKSKMPEWIKDIDPQTTTFFVFQTQNGHIVSWNLKSERTFLRNLISQILHTKYAWTQILWCKYDASRYLGRLASLVRTEVSMIPKELEKERVYRDENGRLKRERYTVPNPEYHRDFRVHGNKIAQHLTLKASSGDVLVVVRGLLCPQISLPDSEITDVDTSLPLLISSVESGGSEWTRGREIDCDLFARPTTSHRSCSKKDTRPGQNVAGLCERIPVAVQVVSAVFDYDAARIEPPYSRSGCVRTARCNHTTNSIDGLSCKK